MLLAQLRYYCWLTCSLQRFQTGQSRSKNRLFSFHLSGCNTLPHPNIIYPRKRSWKGNAAVPKNEKKQQENHFVEKYSQKLCRACPNQPRTWYPICEVGLCMEPFFEAFHMI